MVTAAVLVTKFDLLPLDIDQLDFVGRTEAHIGALAGVDIANDGLDKSAQVSRRAMMDFEHNGSVAIVFYRLSFAEIVSSGHIKS